jgi:hypothetical protein
VFVNTLNPRYADYGAYKLTAPPPPPPTTHATPSTLVAAHECPALTGLAPNRRVLLVAVVRTSFARNRGEVNLGVYQLESVNSTPGDGNRLAGLPSNTASDPNAVDGEHALASLRHVGTDCEQYRTAVCVLQIRRARPASLPIAGLLARARAPSMGHNTCMPTHAIIWSIV